MTNTIRSAASAAALALVTTMVAMPAAHAQMPAASSAIGTTVFAVHGVSDGHLSPGLFARYEGFNVSLQRMHNEDNKKAERVAANLGNPRPEAKGEFNLFSAGYLFEIAPLASEPGVKLGLNVGLIGQSDSSRLRMISPMVSPTASFVVADGWAARISYQPAVRANYKDSAFSIAIERQF